MREKQGIQQELLRTESGEVQQSGPASPVSPSAGAKVTQGGAQTQYDFESVNRDQSFMGTCPDCGSQMEFAEGCAKCHVCGFSECG